MRCGLQPRCNLQCVYLILHDTRGDAFHNPYYFGAEVSYLGSIDKVVVVQGADYFGNTFDASHTFSDCDIIFHVCIQIFPYFVL